MITSLARVCPPRIGALPVAPAKAGSGSAISRWPWFPLAEAATIYFRDTAGGTTWKTEMPRWLSSAPATSSVPRLPNAASEGFTSSPDVARAKTRAAGSEIEAAGGRIVGRSLDARKEEEITTFLQDADAIAPLEVCVFQYWSDTQRPTARNHRTSIPQGVGMACYAGFLDRSYEAARLMLPYGRGNIFFTGATAGLRGEIGLSAALPAPDSACARWRRARRAS